MALGKKVNLPSETLFNASGAGYPDVSLHAENFALTQVRRERERGRERERERERKGERERERERKRETDRESRRESERERNEEK